MSSFIRSTEEWRAITETITAGPVAGGDKALLYQSGCNAVGMITDIVGDISGLKIAEIGSGNGRNAMGLTNYPIAEYRGVEIIRQCVEFCQAAFAPWKNYSFAHADVRNDRYYAAGKMAPENAVYPLESEHYDLVLLMSVLTHEPNRQAVMNIIAEARRALVTGGRLLSTWFTYPHDGIPSNDHARVVFTIDDINSFLSGLDWIEADRPGNDQWYILTQK